MKRLLILLLLAVPSGMIAQTSTNSATHTEHAIIQDKYGDNVCSKDEKVLDKKASEPRVKRRKRYKKKMLRRHRCIYFY